VAASRRKSTKLSIRTSNSCFVRKMLQCDAVRKLRDGFLLNIQYCNNDVW
jgi:hypothetical protein